MNNMHSSSRKIKTGLIKAIKGEETEFTSGSIKKAIFYLSIPMVLEMIMESVFAVVDIYFVSKLGSDAIATVGITESLITIVYALGIGLSTGVAAMVSRRIGEKKPEEASRSAWQSIITGIVIAGLIAVPGILFPEQLLRLMGANETIVNQMSGYTSIMLGGNITIMLLFIINAIFRSAGNPVLSMLVLWCANIINIILDPMLIFGIGPFPELGVAGAAVATNIGRGLAVILQLGILLKGVGIIKLNAISLKPDFNLIFRLLKLASGSVSQYIVATSSWVLLMRIMTYYGSEMVAGYTIAIRIIIFTLLPAFGIANAASTLVGQNLGANKPDRAEKSVWITGGLNVLILSLVGLIYILFPHAFIGIFTDDVAVTRYAISGLQIISIGFVSYGLGMVLVHALNGAGDTKTPFYINVICFWLFEIPLAYFLARVLDWQHVGIFISIILAETLMTLFAFIAFRSGKWKLKVV